MATIRIRNEEQNEDKKKTQEAGGYTINLFSHAWTDRKNGTKKKRR